jgi:phospholipid-transporting ATPase
VGDGANDVNMITAADVGIGIRGKEGTEAARVADFVAGEFKFIRLLTLYYGREWYRKNAELANYCFFKNWFHVAATVAFGGYSYFSGVMIFNVVLYELFNVVYSSWPIILWAVFDEEHSFKESTESPALYSPGITNAHFNQSRFLRSVGSAILFGVTSLLVIVNIMETEVLDSVGTIGGLRLSGSILLAVIIIIVNLKILVMTTGVKPFLLVMTLLSIALYWVSEAIYAQFMDKTEFAFVPAQWKYPSAIFCSLLLIFFMILI